MNPHRQQLLLTLFLGVALAGCTVHHSRQALLLHPRSGYETPSPDARFITEEDSGLSVLGLFVVAEPDHYSVLLERARRDHRCSKLMYPEFDFYTDHWILVAFPISRVTLVCEPERAAEEASDSEQQ